jgi:NADP-dependent aldehyde dehydrogenase
MRRWAASTRCSSCQAPSPSAPRSIAEGLKDSVTLGVGQFCTNPGLTIGVGDDRFDAFVHQLDGLMSAAPSGTMLTSAICDSYKAGVRRLSGIDGVSTSRSPQTSQEPQALPLLFVTDGGAFPAASRNREEVFGPSTVVVRCGSRDELEAVARRLEGQLTATILGTAADLEQYCVAGLDPRTEGGAVDRERFPDGCGGLPLNAARWAVSRDDRLALDVRRHRRHPPVCPAGGVSELSTVAAAAELQDTNPRGIWRLVDGQLTKDAV